MGDKRNARKTTTKARTQTQRAPAKSKPVATSTPARSSTRKRQPTVKAATTASARNLNRPDHSQLEDEGVSQDTIASDILAELDLTPEKNVATPSDGSKNDPDEYDDFEDFVEEFDMGSDGDSDEDLEELTEPRPRQINFKKDVKNSKNGTRPTRGDITFYT